MTATTPPIQGEMIPVELPLYHGKKPKGMKTKVSGYWTRVGRLHQIDDVVVAVVELRMKSEGHAKEGDQVVYVEGMVLADGFEIPGKAGVRMLSELRQAYRSADDATGGKVALAGVGVEGGDADGMVDAAGVRLTPAELAEIRDDPLRVIADERLTPAVVFYSDGTRELWPDEFDPGEPRPVAGDRFDDENAPAGYVYAAELLDAVTGERISVWTDAEEMARLLALEEAAEAVEAKVVAYYKLTFEDGSLAEVDQADTVGPGGFSDDVARAVTVTAVAVDGTETVLKAPEDADDLPPGPDLDGGEFHASGCVLSDDHLGDCLDADGFALTGSTTAVERASGEPPLPGEDEPGGENRPPFGGARALVREEDFRFVDQQVPTLVADLRDPDVVDLARARRLLEAEKLGRGRSLKPRKGALEAIEARIAELEAEAAP